MERINEGPKFIDTELQDDILRGSFEIKLESYRPDAKDIAYFFGPDFDPNADIEELIEAINSLSPLRRKTAEVYLAEEDLRVMTGGIDPVTDSPFENQVKQQGALLIQVGIIINLQEELRGMRGQEGR